MQNTTAKKSFLKLKLFCESQDFKGWDPYDGLNSKLFNKTPFLKKSRFARLAWIQLFKRLPVNLRPITGVDKTHNPKGLGLFLIGYCNLYKTEKKEAHLIQINNLINLLLEKQAKGYSGACWGYNFDWQARAFFQPKNTPTVVATSFITEALIEAYHSTKRKDILETLKSVGLFITKDLNKTFDDKNNFTLSYSPLDHTQVFNAGLLGVKTLCLLYPIFKEEEYLTFSKKIVQYVVDKQQETGAWAYSNLPYHQWVDSFHTGYNLECLHAYQHISGDTSYQNEIDLGFDYYINNFFTTDGKSKYYNNQTYPIDIHAPAQFIVTLYKLGKLQEYSNEVNQVLTWTITNMQDKKGYFYYQKRKFLSSKIPYMRWAQAWMFYAFSYYIKSNS